VAGASADAEPPVPPFLTQRIVSVIALRYVYLVAVAVWLGGMLAIGMIVAPALFQTLPSLSPEDGRAFAGETFKVILARFHRVAYTCGGTAFVALVVMALLGPRPRHFSIRALVLAAMLGISIYSGRYALGGIDAIQAEVGTLPSRLPSGDPRRVRFDELHRLATILMMVNIVGALGLLGWEAAADHQRADDIVGTA
jgi:hypothetical protein